MKSPYNMTCWQGASGIWYCNDVKNLNNDLSKWYAPMRLLNLSIDEYVDLLLKYNAKITGYSAVSEILHFHFDTEREAKAFCRYVNKHI